MIEAMRIIRFTADRALPITAFDSIGAMSVPSRMVTEPRMCIASSLNRTD